MSDSREGDFLINGPDTASITLVLAHGAGAPMDSPFMNAIAEGLACAGVRVARFEFPYMRERRGRGGRRAPDREPVLLETWRSAIERLGGASHLAIGGKSLGGRIAGIIADEVSARGLLCLGYPFHPPGKAPGARLSHPRTLRTPALIVQGTRDPFGNRAEVEGYELSPRIRIKWIEDGDHSFRPRARSGRSEAGNLAEAIAAAAGFIREI